MIRRYANIVGMNDDTPEKRSVGRPRKRSTDKKPHRVQVAMSDQQKADADRLAELQDVSLSEAVASSVSVALRALEFDRYVDAAVELLKAAAVRTASEIQDGALSKYADKPLQFARVVVVGGTDVEVQRPLSYHDLFMRYAMSDGRFPLYVRFAASRKTYRELKTPLLEVYDSALRAYVREVAETHRDAAIGLDIGRFPYRADKTVVVFAYLVGDGDTAPTIPERQYHYLQPLDSGGIYAHLPSSYGGADREKVF